MSKIHNITPINNETTAQNCREQILAFLKTIFTEKDIIKENDIISKRDSNGLEEVNCDDELREITLRDGSNWHASQGRFHNGLDRFIGYKYLARCLTELGIKQYIAAETKCKIKNEALTNGLNITINKRGYYGHKNILTISSNSFLSFSKDAGTEFPPLPSSHTQINELEIIKNEIGFVDLSLTGGDNVLFDSITGICVLIDTEYSSFSSKNCSQENIISPENAVLLSGITMKFSLAEIFAQ